MQTGRIGSQFKIRGNLVREPHARANGGDSNLYFFTLIENYQSPVQGTTDKFVKRTNTFDLVTSDKKIYEKLIKAGVGSVIEVHGSLNTREIQPAEGNINSSTGKPWPVVVPAFFVTSLNVLVNRNTNKRTAARTAIKAIEDAVKAIGAESQLTIALAAASHNYDFDLNALRTEYNAAPSHDEQEDETESGSFQGDLDDFNFDS